MSRQKERNDRLARANDVAIATIEEERAARATKTAKLRALRVAREEKERSAADALPRKERREPARFKRKGERLL